MDILAINDFKHLNDNIEVVTVKTLYDHIDQDIVKGRNEINVNEPEKQPWIEVSSVLNSFLKHNEYDHIFIDELPTLSEFFEMDEKFNFHNALEKGTTFCMTLKSQEFHENIWLSLDPSKLTEDFKREMEINYNAKVTQLKCNMRNSDNIVNLALVIKTPMKSNIDFKCHRPEKNIIGPVCYHVALEWGEEVKEEERARAVIHKYFQERCDEPVVFLISDKSTSGINIYKELHNTFSRDRKVVFLPLERFKMDGEAVSKHIEEVRHFLDNPQGILVSSIESFFGAQARNVVFTRNNENYILNSVYRSMSFAIIVGDTLEFSAGPVVIKDDDVMTYADSEECSQCQRMISTKNMPNHMKIKH